MLLPGHLVVKKNSTTLESLKVGVVLCSEYVLNKNAWKGFETVLVLWNEDGFLKLDWFVASSLMQVTPGNAQNVGDRCKLKL